ncbi:MAG: penicillin acylase family protein [Sphingobacteriales bacterium]|nr:penicillin acylase family protein [Sphingobacteriales bacterium]MBI3719196.1 penicillin acylase family protein [Sphingobacteriales bacterium]
MRIVPFLISATVTVSLVYALNKKLGPAPPLGKFLSPQHGFWQNADPSDMDYNADLKLNGLKDDAEVYIDERLVPHVFVKNETDAYFVQGYLHAKFRLWQMEFQTHAAAGRISEILGENPKVLNFDREQRRLGMVYAAERSLQVVEADPDSKTINDAYTAGVNAWIDELKESELPIEYKLLDYEPEHWTNLKTALFLKYMSKDLAGSENDFEYTNAKTIFSAQDFEKLYPLAADSLDPIIPKGTPFTDTAVALKIPATADSLYFAKKDTINIKETKPDPDNGSNNWAVSGKKTKSGYPILCNDPHLSLNLPSLWFEMQLSTPTYNAYGATFPGAPAVIIGFNDSCSFGFTNGGRDVRDYYEISFLDSTRMEYKFNNEWKKTNWRVETIKVKGKPDYIDSVAYIPEFGPVMYDRSFTGNNRTESKHYYACRWKAHDPSNEIKIFIGLDRAKNYNDYAEAIKNLHTPGQNCVFACKNGDIALWCQGEFPAKWKDQGKFVMPGTDSSYMWQSMIPQYQNPHQHNPARNFVSSANQVPVDITNYPYYLGGSYPLYRGISINRRLSAMDSGTVTVDDMKKLQTDNYNVFAEYTRPLLLKYIDATKLNDEERKYLDQLRNWNLRNDINETGPTIFNLWYDTLQVKTFADELNKTSLPLHWPEASTLSEALAKDPSYKFIDNINTPQKETAQDIVTAALKAAVPVIKQAEANHTLAWAAFKDTHVSHLTKQAAFSRLHLPIGGGNHIINATKADHGPSWRMIVEMTPQTNAWGVYPGGQNGNPGSKYYDMFIDKWAAGEYYPLWLMKASEKNDKRVKWVMKLSKM